MSEKVISIFHYLTPEIEELMDDPDFQELMEEDISNFDFQEE